MYQPAVTDTTTLRRYRQELAVSKFLSSLILSIRSQVRGHILKVDKIPTLTTTFSRVMRVSTGIDMSPTPFIKQSVMVFGRDKSRGHGRNRDFREGHGSFRDSRCS